MCWERQRVGHAVGCCTARLCSGKLRACAPALQDIAILRAEGMLAAEELLYWRLIDLYRLPQVMYQLTGMNPAPMARA